MKAEITPENKAKFFAQYWGQDVLSSDMYGDNGTIYSLTMKEDSLNDKWLLLKPLSLISDECASVIRGIIWEYPGYKSMINAHYVVNNLDITSLPIECADIITTYLRSKGYAVDWMGLDIEEMIEAGWIKLIEP